MSSKPRLSSSLSSMKFMQKAISSGTVSAAPKEEEKDKRKATKTASHLSLAFQNPNEWILPINAGESFSSPHTTKTSSDTAAAVLPARRRTVDSFLPLLHSYSADTTTTARHLFKKTGGDLGDMRVDVLDEEGNAYQELEDSLDQDQGQETTTLQAFLNQSAKLNKNLMKRSGAKNLSNMHASKPSKIPVSKVSKKKK